MAKYRRVKSLVVEAEQFKLGKQSPAGVVPVAIDFDGRVLHEYRRGETGFQGNLGFGLKTPEGWRVVIHGDWIITDRGQQSLCNATSFAETYELVVE
jgi:hypothetical protein